MFDISASFLKALRASVTGALITVLGLAGCSAISSEKLGHIEKEQGPTEGVHYFLPLLVLNLTLTFDSNSGTYKVETTPTSIPDRSRRYVLRHIPLPNYNDKLKVNLNTKGHFLAKVGLDAKDESISIIDNIAQTFGALSSNLESAQTTAASVLLTVAVDPADPLSVQNAATRINQEVRKSAERERNAACKKSDEDIEAGFAVDLTRHKACERFKQLAGHSMFKLAAHPAGTSRQCDPRNSKIVVEAIEATPSARQSSESHRHCERGICYRPAVPYEFCVISADRTITRSFHMVPNRQQLVEIDIERALLVDKVQIITFDDNSGLLTDIQVYKESEFLALSSIPLVVLKGISSGLALKATLINKESASLQSQTALLQERARLAAAQARLEAAIQSRSSAAVSSYAAVPKSVPAQGTQPGGTLFDTTRGVQ